MAFTTLMHWSLPEGVHACCTTRTGGVSLTPFDSWNLGGHVGDDPRVVAVNRQRLHAQLGFARPVFLHQVHGVDVVNIDANTPDGTVADACLTDKAGLACTIMVADCLPLLFTDAHGRAVAAAHAGWRGLASGVVENTLFALCRQAAVEPHQIRVWLGPCIGATAFEIGVEVYEAFLKHDRNSDEFFVPHSSRPQKWWADLAGLARQRLLAQGVREISGNNGSAAWCTVQQRSDFFSYRRDGVTGRFAACIWLSR